MLNLSATEERRWIVYLQLASMAVMWVFVVSISVWILNLIRLSVLLNDQVTASVGISLVAIPVFFSVASVLTYVFVGLQRGRTDAQGAPAGQEERS